MNSRLQKYGLLLTGLALVSLTSACKSKSERSQGACTPEVESLYYSLDEQLNKFNEALRAYQRGRMDQRSLGRIASETVTYCHEFMRVSHHSSCSSRDRFSGSEIQIQSEIFIEDCNLAANYQDGRGGKHPSPPPGRNHWSDRSILDFQEREIAFFIEDNRTALEAVRSRSPKVLVDGQLMDEDRARGLLRRGMTACALRARSELPERRALPVIKIQNHSRDRQSVTLITSQGLQVSCQNGSSDTMTARDIQAAFGSVIQIKRSSSRGR